MTPTQSNATTALLQGKSCLFVKKIKDMESCWKVMNIFDYSHVMGSNCEGLSCNVQVAAGVPASRR